MGRIEMIGAVNKGKAYFEMPAEHPRPEIVPKNRFRARKVFWAEVTDVPLQFLKEAAVKLGDTISDWPTWDKTWDTIPGAKWHWLIIYGKDCRPRKGMRKWILCLLVAPPYEFDTGKFHVASLRDSGDARTFSIFGQMLASPIVKSSVGWEEFAEFKKTQVGDSWNEDQEKAYRKEWKDKYAGGPKRWYGLWLPRYLRPDELRQVDGLKLALLGTALDAQANAADAAKAQALESTVKAQDTRIVEQARHIQDQDLIISRKASELDDVTTELELKSRPPIVPQAPQMPAFAVSSLTSPETKRKSPEPGQLKSYLWLLMFMVGIGALFAGPYGITGGVVLIIAASAMYYLDYVREDKKKTKQKEKEEAPKAGMTEEAKAVLGKASDKLTGTS